MRTPANDHLATKAKIHADKAPEGSRERKAWDSVAGALAATGTIESIDPRRVSFTTARDAVRRRISDPGSFPPSPA
jgi:hypothetical protein